MEPLIPYFDVVKIPITGDFAIHGFGILVALGFVLGSHQAAKKAERDGLDPELINRLVSWMVAGVFIGGHAGHLLFYEPQDLINDPAVIFQVWKGLSSFGGFIGCAVLGIWFFRREDAKIRKANKVARKGGGVLQARVNTWAYADSGLFGFTLGWFSGRMGCFVAHDHPGTETDFWLGVKGMFNPNTFDTSVASEVQQKAAWIQSHVAEFPQLADISVKSRIPADVWQQVAYHDMGLYEALWSLGMFGLFLILDRKPRPPGFFVGLLFAVYGPVRLVMDVFRHTATDTRYFLDLTPAQILSVAMGLLGFWILWSKRNETPIRMQMEAFRAANPPVATEGAADDGLADAAGGAEE